MSCRRDFQMLENNGILNINNKIFITICRPFVLVTFRFSYFFFCRDSLARPTQVHVTDGNTIRSELLSLILPAYMNRNCYRGFHLAGNVADMSATCRPDSQMSALLADTAELCRHKIDPDTTFSCRGWPTFTPFFFLYQSMYVHTTCQKPLHT
jgi:hypothetical protein